mmetsp:Transcript_6481/g.16087  ORF Transcript_6481/g.16087 Transcript_6481/m.16087 type:complete len:242 (+) Transcript_6481:391-1116(+)
MGSSPRGDTAWFAAIGVNGESTTPLGGRAATPTEGATAVWAEVTEPMLNAATCAATCCCASARCWRSSAWGTTATGDSMLMAAAIAGPVMSPVKGGTGARTAPAALGALSWSEPKACICCISFRPSTGWLPCRCMGSSGSCCMTMSSKEEDGPLVDAATAKVPVSPTDDRGDGGCCCSCSCFASTSTTRLFVGCFTSWFSFPSPLLSSFFSSTSFSSFWRELLYPMVTIRFRSTFHQEVCR